jgi:hypothetical protein
MVAVKVKILKKGAAPELGLKQRRPLEKTDFKTRLMADLDALLPGDAFAFAMPGSSSFDKLRMRMSGIPDILIIHRGRALGLELAGGRLSDDQNAMVLKLRAAGMRIEVARSWSEALRALREMGVALANKDTLTRQVAEIFRDAQKGRAR